VYWKRNVAVDKALLRPGLALHKLTRFLDYCSYTQDDKKVLTESFNSESFLGKDSVLQTDPVKLSLCH